MRWRDCKLTADSQIPEAHSLSFIKLRLCDQYVCLSGLINLLRVIGHQNVWVALYSFYPITVPSGIMAIYHHAFHYIRLIKLAVWVNLQGTYGI